LTKPKVKPRKYSQLRIRVFCHQNSSLSPLCSQFFFSSSPKWILLLLLPTSPSTPVVQPSWPAIYKLLPVVFFHSSSSLRLQNTLMTPHRMFLSFLCTLWEHNLQQLTGTCSSPPWPTARQHHMILRLRQPKTTLSTATTTATAAPISWVVSPPTREPITFTDANRYESWHGVMREEIKALRTNKTWTFGAFSSFDECCW